MRHIVLLFLSLLPWLVQAQPKKGSDDFLSWQESPNTRGTMDIIWTCLFTVFICTWTVVHLNIPAPPKTDTTVRLWLRRIKWGLFFPLPLPILADSHIVGNCCMVPEIVLLLAAGQWSFARRCWREMRQIITELDESSYELESGLTIQPKSLAEPIVNSTTRYSETESEKMFKTDMTRPKLRRSETFEEKKKRKSDERWTLRHAFYANMGGFRLKDSTGKIYIVNAKHINHLVRKRYIDLPKITPLEINDRSKSDSLAKFLALLQVGWLAIEVIARTIQNLETTSLEITTLSFVVCTLGTFIAWYRKPYDVQTFIVLDMPGCAIDEIDLTFTERDGTERDLLQEYIAGHQTIRVVDEEGNLVAPFDKLAIIDDGLPTFTASFTDVHGKYWGRKPYYPDRIRNDRLPVMEKAVTAVCALATIGYAALHISAWNIPLATHIEQLLWRIASLVMLACVFAWFFMDHFQEYLLHRKRKKGKVIDGVIVPWWRIPASIVVAVVYGLCRLYVLVESFVALRKMPASAYEQVDWGKWVPHL